MRKDERLLGVKRLIEAGDITMLDQCFRIIPKTVVAEALGEHKGRFTNRLNGIVAITYKDITNLSGLFDVEPDMVFKLIMNQAQANKEDKT